jgi:hypothetical protein
VSRFCRHNRLTVDCPICSKDIVPAVTRKSARRPPAAPGRRRAASGRGQGVSTSRGPYALAGPYAGGVEVRLERVPGGLRLAEWHAGQITRRAPQLDAADIPRLLADAADKGLVEAQADRPPTTSDGDYGASPGRTGELRDELRVERVNGDRLRIARWVLRPNAGWQLQEAPVMLPPARFKEAIESAADRGVLARGGTVGAPGPEER